MRASVAAQPGIGARSKRGKLWRHGLPLLDATAQASRAAAALAKRVAEQLTVPRLPLPRLTVPPHVLPSRKSWRPRLTARAHSTTVEWAAPRAAFPPPACQQPTSQRPAASKQCL